MRGFSIWRRTHENNHGTSRRGSHLDWCGGDQLQAGPGLWLVRMERQIRVWVSVLQAGTLQGREVLPASSVLRSCASGSGLLVVTE